VIAGLIVLVLLGFLWVKGMHKSLMRAKKSPLLLEAEAHVLVLINCNLMIFNEPGINRKLFEPAIILIVLYFDPKITHTRLERSIILIISKF